MQVIELSGDYPELSGFKIKKAFKKVKKAAKTVKPLTSMASPMVKSLAASNPYTKSAYDIGKMAKGNVKNMSAAFKEGGVKGLLKSSVTGGLLPPSKVSAETSKMLQSIGLKNIDDIDLSEIPNDRSTEINMVGKNFALSGDLMMGANNNADLVRSVQRALVSAGYNIYVDGIYGAQTQAAVVKFQKSKGLTADGIVGKRTMTALGLSVSTAPSPVTVSKPVSNPVSILSTFSKPSATGPSGGLLDKFGLGNIDGKILFAIIAAVAFFYLKGRSQNGNGKKRTR